MAHREGGIRLSRLLTSEAARRGAAHFNAGEYFEAHEAWEEVWMAAAEPRRSFYQGLIQLAAGGVKLRRGQPGAAVKLLRKGSERLRRYLASVGGRAEETWLAEFLRAVEACREELSRRSEGQAAMANAARLPRLPVG